MKKLFTTIIAALFLSFAAQAQMAEPVNWTFTAEKINANEYQIKLTANIEDGWFVYSQNLPKRGPVPTQIKFDENPNLVLNGKTEEVGAKKESFDETFNMTVIKFSGQTQFIQKVKVVGDALEVRGKLTFMTCNSETCMPPKKVAFNVSLKN